MSIRTRRIEEEPVVIGIQKTIGRVQHSGFVGLIPGNPRRAHRSLPTPPVSTETKLDIHGLVVNRITAHHTNAPISLAMYGQVVKLQVGAIVVVGGNEQLGV